MSRKRYRSVNLPVDLHREIKQEAARLDTTILDLIATAWRRYMRSPPEAIQPNPSRYRPEHEEFHDLLEEILVGGKPGERAGLLLLLRNTAGDSRPSPRASRKPRASGG